MHVRRNPGDDRPRVFLVVVDRVEAPEEDDGDERNEAEPVRAHEPARAEQEHRAEDHREVARRPAGRELRGDERRDDRHAGERREREHDPPLLVHPAPHHLGETGAAHERQRDECSFAAQHGPRGEHEIMEGRHGRPRRARVLRLREQRRQPRRVEHGDAERHEPEQLQPLTREYGGRDGETDADEQPPVVRVEHQSDGRHEQGGPAAAAAKHALDVRIRDHEREECLELVHARLLRVVGEERVERGEQRADEAGPPVEQRPCRRVRKRDARQPEEQRQRVRRALAVAEGANPEPEQHVVRRRRTVLAQQRGNRRPVMVGEADRDALVDPEPCVQLPRANEQRERGQRDEDDRRRPAPLECTLPSA